MIELRTLGSLDLRVPGGGEVRSVLAQPKRLALLAYLAIDAPDGFARRDTLLGMFWPESDDEHARGAFRQSVRYLRRSLGEGVLVNRAEEELGIAEGALWCDAAEFRRAAGAGEAGRALELYRGDLLDGFCVAGAPEFERWLEAERSALRAKAAAAAWTLAGTAEAAGDAASACEWARRAVGLAPLDEGGVRRRIALLDRSGDRAGAMSAYEEFARHLAAELELEPAPETRALAEDIRCRDAAVQLPVRPLGERKPKDEGHVVAVGAPASSPPPSARSRVAGRLAVVSAVVVLALTGLAYLALPRTGEPPLNPRRVVVAPFENRTGDPALDPVASMTADWIIQGLSGRGALEVVPVTAALTSARYLSVAGSPAAAERDPRPLARETGAGTAVSGSYYRQGDSLHFQARITEAASGRLLAAIGSEAAAVETPLDGIDRLRQRVLVALAPLSDERDTHVRLARAPPSYEAYRAYVSGFENFVHRDVRGALRHFERAAAADPAFLMPALAAAIMHVNLGNYAAADSIARRVDRSRDDLGPFELATLHMLQGWLRGDHAMAYEATVRQARMAPGSIGEYQQAEQARRLNRPGETVRVLTAMGAERGELRGWFGYWRELGDAHHMLGDHRVELQAARRAREVYPADPRVIFREVQALAALGRVADVEARIEERLTSASREWPSEGALMATAARELRAHGRADAASPLFERSLAWYRAQAAGGLNSTDDRSSVGTVLYDSGRWGEAREVFAMLAAENPENVSYHGHLGVIAARRGDRAEAERISAWLRDLDQPYRWGAHTLWRARIASVAGDHEQAVDLLSQAFAQGRQHGVAHHTNIDLEPLRDNPRFRALMQPKG